VRFRLAQEASLREQMRKYQGLEVAVHAAPDKQISLTDPDARSMATSGRIRAWSATMSRPLQRPARPLWWDQRIARDGWAVRQASNAYELLTATAPSEHALRSGGQSGRETRWIDISYCPQFIAAEIQAAQAALAQRRAVVESRLLGKGMRAPVAKHGRSCRISSKLAPAREPETSFDNLR
jgi:hypothetical protein